MHMSDLHQEQPFLKFSSKTLRGKKKMKFVVECRDVATKLDVTLDSRYCQQRRTKHIICII